MQAAVLESLGNLKLRDVPIPEIDDDSALLRVEAVSICGSDVRIMRHGNPRVVLPAIIGHETAGTVVKAGKNVSRVKVGDRVAIGADVPCGQCDWCRNGMGNNCAINYAIGYQIPGSFAEYMKLPRLVLDEGPVTPFSEGLSFERAALAEPLACAINGLELVNLSLGKSIAIIGLGPIGCMMIDLARIMGATQVIAVQRSAKRMEIGRSYGADAYISSDTEDVVSRCRELTGGKGPDVIMTTCGSVEAHEQAIEMVAQRGYVNLFGGLGKDARAMSLFSNTVHYKECFVTGSHGSTPRQHALAVKLLEKDLVRVAPIITHHFPLSEIVAAFDTMESRKGMKIVVEPQRG
ncbi:MAG: alcohol dehydrogenase catalytic domain-containing protein [Capsulimonadaceae bacterium]|nr:alcohol dehydrogenase catalytic domain-containing protein [Capsulimonadaceae bacterium]